jgi:hypothetical protein
VGSLAQARAIIVYSLHRLAIINALPIVCFTDNWLPAAPHIYKLGVVKTIMSSNLRRVGERFLTAGALTFRLPRWSNTHLMMRLSSAAVVLRGAPAINPVIG